MIISYDSQISWIQNVPEVIQQMLFKYSFQISGFAVFVFL
jgi:hypothetical protein